MLFRLVSEIAFVLSGTIFLNADPSHASISLLVRAHNARLFPPLKCVLQPNSTTTSCYPPSSSMPAGLHNLRRYPYSTPNTRSVVSDHGEYPSKQAVPNAGSAHYGDASTYSSGRSQDSSGVGLGTAGGWASATSSTRADADNRRRESTKGKRRGVSRDSYAIVTIIAGRVGSVIGRRRAVRVSYVIYVLF